MYCTKASTQRVENRGHADGKCNQCGSQIMIESTGRSIWFDGTMGGGGDVERVGEVYCPECDGEPELPSYGTPIYESEIVEVATA